MIQFCTILREACVAVGVEASDKSAALAAITELLVSGGGATDAPRLLSEVRAREAVSSTGIGEGVAVPHALSDAITETAMAVVRLARPIEFEAVDGEPVDLLFLLAGPRGGSSTHLQLLSKLARLLHDPSFRKAARDVPDGASLARLLYGRD